MKNRIWFTSSWGDNVQCAQGDYAGPQIDALMQKVKAAGGDALLWRADGGGRAQYHSRHLAVGPGEKETPRRAEAITKGLAACDPLHEAVAAAHRHGLKLHAWTCLFDSRIVRPKSGRLLFDPYLQAHPEWWLLSKDGKQRLEGVPCYAYPEVVEHRLQHYRELLADYRVDGLHLSTRSHARSNPGIVDVQDWYGYNQPWIEEFRQRYGGVDPLMERLPTHYADRWIELRGECITHLIRKVRQLTRSHQAHLSIDLDWKQDRIIGAKEKGPEPILAERDWPTWVGQDLIDYLVIVLNRRNVHDLRFLKHYRPHFPDTAARLVIWFNLKVRQYGPDGHTVTRMVTPEEIARMKAAIGSSSEIACFHETANIEFHAKEGEYWEAIGC